ncbi:MAG: GDP-mannose 4,6-dehydratase [Phycisphaerales bacterium]
MLEALDGPVLVTGAAGFIASHLMRSLLTSGADVVGVDNFDAFYGRDRKWRNLEVTAAQGPGTFDFHEADICDVGAMAALTRRCKPRLVVHVAALAGVRPSIAEPARYAAVNLDGLVSVLEAARGSGCRAVLFASSSSVYGNHANVPFAETHDVSEPISPYAATKRAGELLCHTWSHLNGMAIASLRFFTVFGPAQRPDLAISKFMQLIADGKPIPMFGDGTSSRDYTFVEDIVAGIRAAGERVVGHAAAGRAEHRIYNLGGSEPVTLSEMIDAIAETVGRPAKIEKHPMQPGDVNRTWADLSRSRAELGFAPVTSFRDGLARQWEWARSQSF